MAITKKELNPRGYILTEEQQKNLDLLFIAMNKIRAAYGRPMLVTSGVRSPQDQMRINPSHMKSAHLLAAACDINDPERDLWNWILLNLNTILSCGLYVENRTNQMRHCHFQIIRPKSGNIIFNP